MYNLWRKLNGFRNRTSIVKSYLSKKKVTTGYPSEVVLEMSRKCNYACTMCFTPFLTREEGFMQPDVFHKVLDKVAPHAEMIYLSGGGEPLLNRNTVDYVKQIKERGIPVGLATNCSLLTEKRSEKLIRNGLDYIIIPMDGISKETYEQIRINGNFENVIRNVRNFIQQKKELNSRVFIQIMMIALPDNKHELPFFPQYVKDLGFGDLINDVRIKPEINFSHQEEGWNKINRPCFLLWRNLYVSWSGVAFACSQDSHGTMQIGDFRRQTLDEIWNSEVMQKQRQLHLDNIMCENSVCDKCGLNQEYFKPFTVAATTFFDTYTLKKKIALYERYVLGESKEAFPERMDA